MIRFALTIFLSAFLLFQVQPLVSKRILPWFGGSPAVWTTCMLFFQMLLLGGYVYAHLIGTRLHGRRQVVTHLAVLGLAALAVPLLFLPLFLGGGWKPDSPGSPTWRIAALLAVTVGLPFFALSSTSPLLQKWFTLARPKGAVYRLYALSNVGSLLALLSFPVVMEPFFTTRTLVIAWSAGFALFVAFCAWSGVGALRPAPDMKSEISDLRSQNPAAAVPQHSEEPVPLLVWLLWLLLPACASIMLLAVTNQMCQDVAVVPFLWVLPLGIYLLSFIICFDSERWYYRPIFWPLMIGMIVSTYILLRAGASANFVQQIGGYALGLFACAMVCHGELVRLRPGPRHLTAFYLMVAAGGALGGAFVTLAAPFIFKTYAELHLGLWLSAAVALGALVYSQRARLSLDLANLRCWPTWLRLGGIAVALVGLAWLGVALAQNVWYAQRYYIRTTRNFYGVLRVSESHKDDPEEHSFTLLHGRINHGVQYTGSLRRTPVSYYGSDAGLALAIRNYPRPSDDHFRVGTLGLGAATVAAFGKKGDVFRFYEINENVVKLSEGGHGVEPVFTYLADARAAGVDYGIIMGDGRLSLENEKTSQQFDVLALDAFAGDAVPVHLLTREAFEIYARHMRRDAAGRMLGVIAVHISNRHLNLMPVVVGVAQHFGWQMAYLTSEDRDRYNNVVKADNPDKVFIGSYWMLLTDNKEFLELPAIKDAAKDNKIDPRAIYWTDDFSGMFTIIK